MSQASAQREVQQALQGDGPLTPEGSAKVQEKRSSKYIAIPSNLANHHGIEQSTEATMAFGLGARCGLWSDEVVRVAPEHVVDTDAGITLRVWEGAKTGKFRETTVPSDLATTIRTVGEVREASQDEPVVDRSSHPSAVDWRRSRAPGGRDRRIGLELPRVSRSPADVGHLAPVRRRRRDGGL